MTDSFIEISGFSVFGSLLASVEGCASWDNNIAFLYLLPRVSLVPCLGNSNKAMPQIFHTFKHAELRSRISVPKYNFKKSLNPLLELLSYHEGGGVWFRSHRRLPKQQNTFQSLHIGYIQFLLFLSLKKKRGTISSFFSWPCIAVTSWTSTEGQLYIVPRKNGSSLLTDSLWRMSLNGSCAWPYIFVPALLVPKSANVTYCPDTKNATRSF